MPLHRLTQIVMGVPDPEATAAYYTDFGLLPTSAEARGDSPPASPSPGDHVFSTADGGEQLRIVRSARRRLLQLGIGADDPDDLDRVAASLAALGMASERTSAGLRATDPGTGVAVHVELADRISQEPHPAPPYNAPGAAPRIGRRAPGILRGAPVRPRKLGHVVLGSTDQEASETFFQQGIGFKVSDTVPGLAAFMRCSTDHHNLAIQSAPVQFLHHTSWQVDDVDEVGRGAIAMLEKDPDRHVWGLGRHHIGSNFFWYLKDPAGNFSEYYSDMDCIVDDALWNAEVWDAAHAMYTWGPPPPPSMLAPEDLAGYMVGAHSVTEGGPR